MSSNNLLKILLIIFIAFALGEIVFTISRYGLPQIDLFKPKPGSCKILEEKFCTKSKLTKYKDTEGREYTSIALNLPPGTTIFAPVDGVLSKVQIKQPSPFQGIEVSINDSKSPTVNYALRGDIKPNSMTSENVKSGQNIGVIGNTGAKNFDKYNFSLDIVKPDPAQGRFVSEETILKTLFRIGESE